MCYVCNIFYKLSQISLTFVQLYPSVTQQFPTIKQRPIKILVFPQTGGTSSASSLASDRCVSRLKESNIFRWGFPNGLWINPIIERYIFWLKAKLNEMAKY
jgi:hypothetical protein